MSDNLVANLNPAESDSIPIEVFRCCGILLFRDTSIADARPARVEPMFFGKGLDGKPLMRDLVPKEAMDLCIKDLEEACALVATMRARIAKLDRDVATIACVRIAQADTEPSSTE
jgi:hypothetical protein